MSACHNIRTGVRHYSRHRARRALRSGRSSSGHPLNAQLSTRVFMDQNTRTHENTRKHTHFFFLQGRLSVSHFLFFLFLIRQSKSCRPPCRHVAMSPMSPSRAVHALFTCHAISRYFTLFHAISRYFTLFLWGGEGAFPLCLRVLCGKIPHHLFRRHPLTLKHQ